MLRLPGGKSARRPGADHKDVEVRHSRPSRGRRRGRARCTSHTRCTLPDPRSGHSIRGGWPRGDRAGGTGRTDRRHDQARQGRARTRAARCIVHRRELGHERDSLERCCAPLLPRRSTPLTRRSRRTPPRWPVSGLTEQRLRSFPKALASSGVCAVAEALDRDERFVRRTVAGAAQVRVPQIERDLLLLTV